MTARRLLRLGALALLLVAVGLPVLSCASVEVGLVDGQLKPCPGSPNCVNSQDPDEGHRVPPLPVPGELDSALDDLQAVLESLPRVQVVSREGDYLHAVFVSRLFRFRDDVEFLLDRQAGHIDVRSASRVGYSDLGANRARVDELRRLLQPAAEAR